jgi:hypothetical protein
MHIRGRAAGREIDEQAMADKLRTYLIERGRKPAEAAEALVVDFLNASRARGSLMDERAGYHRFSHLSFQEFLTARYLAEAERDVNQIARFFEEQDRALEPWWREPALLTAGYLSVTTPHTAADFVHRLARLGDTDAPRTALSLSAAELAATAFLEWGGADVTREQLADRLASLLSDANLRGATGNLRAAAGRALSYLGDPRPGVGLADSYPQIVWCEVPAGPFLMGAGSNEQGWKDELPQHQVNVGAFFIARYPVTNAQYAAFIQAGGYEDRRWWSQAGWNWREGGAPDTSHILMDDWRAGYEAWVARRPPSQRSEPL